MPPPFQPRTIYDGISSFQDGMNSDLVPLLLPKTQLSFASNLTVRGGYATDRPPVTKNFTYTWPSDEVQTAVEQGLFQGSTYYQPDSGFQSLIASISGRLFQFTINDNAITVREITIPGDPNPATTTQVWMWQAENYVIVMDGLSLPIFFDGTSSRRSRGGSTVLATLAAGPYTAPEIGNQLAVTTVAPYTGEYNVPVLMHGAFYQPIENTSGYMVELTSLFVPTGATSDAGTQVVSEPQNLGYMKLAVSIPANDYGTGVVFALDLDTPRQYSGTITLEDSGGTNRTFSLYGGAVPGNPTSIFVAGIQPAMDFPVGTKTQLTGSAPNVLIGSAVNAYTIPPVGSSVQVLLDTPYTGAPGATIFAGGVEYSITAVPPAAPGTTLTLINLTDTDTTANNIIAGDEILSVPELPPGRMGAYGMAQNWLSLVDGLQYIASDVSRGPSGTPANNYRDAVLKIVDLTFRGGNFAIPTAGNPINSMTFVANLDGSLGQGPLQIGTAVNMFSQVAPFDYTNPPNPPFLTYSLIGTGPLAQNSTFACNSDTIFRSVTGLGSLILARREFNSWGNTPISAEMTRTINLDNPQLLGYSTGIVFDNRILESVSPQASSQGVFHNGAIALNLDPVSSLRGKQPSVYDGLWTGLNVLKYDVGIFNGKQRAFAFTFNVTLSKIELYELLPTGDEHFDNGTTPITWFFETAALFNQDVKDPSEFIRLLDGEFAVDDVTGPVRFNVQYKADQNSCWTNWHSFSICAANGSEPQYFPRLGFGEPSSQACDPILKTPNREGYTFQIRFQIVGHCRFLRARFAAVTQPIPQFKRPICDAECPP